MSKFINPYNFIPLEKTKACSNKKEEEYSGCIQYTLLTKTPLFIPNTSNENAFKIDVRDHKSFDFFSYNDLSDNGIDCKKTTFEPVIPGSEIRGLIRSNFEILTNSCLPFYDEDAVLSKRTSETFKPGLLKYEDGSYRLFSAEDLLLRTQSGANDLTIDSSSWAGYGDSHSVYNRKCYIQNSLEEGQQIWFSARDNGRGKRIITGINTGETEGMESGYVVKGEAGPEVVDKHTHNPKKVQKHCCHIFKEGNCIRELRREEIQTLKEVVKLYLLNNKTDIPEKRRDESEEDFWNRFLDQTPDADRDAAKEEYIKDNRAHKEYKRHWETEPKPDVFPVYYSTADETHHSYYMLSPACITREIYQTKMKDLLNEHTCCSDDNELCPACNLFGIISKGFQKTSRLRFTDLHLNDESKKELVEGGKYDKLYEGIKTLKPLGGPMLNNTEFYLKRPDNAWFWTYDYEVSANGNLTFYTNGKGAEINGRKFYWHNLSPDYESDVKNNLNITIRPIKKDVKFDGRVFFQNLSKDELDALIYTLLAGDNEELSKKTHGYKLGHGKPLGLGSVAIHVDEIKTLSVLRDDNNKNINIGDAPYSYSINKIQDENELLSKETCDHFFKMTDFNALVGVNLPVSYPFVSPNGEIFKWFAENHTGWRRRNGQIEEANMINSRKQMAIGEYMEAMNPRLQSTGFIDKVHRNNRNADNIQNNANNNNNIQTGIVDSYNPQKSAVKIKLKNEKTISVYFKNIPGAKNGEVDKVLSIGNHVKVKYIGVDEQNRTQWKVVK